MTTPTITDEHIAEIEKGMICGQLVQTVYNPWLRGLIDRLREAEKDAARYQHLIESGHFVPSSFGNRWALRMSGDAATKQELDAIIDAAMAKPEPNPPA